jgi:glutathione S-transferase
MTGYSTAANKRGLGFGIQVVAAMLLWLGALVGVVRHFVQ